MFPWKQRCSSPLTSLRENCPQSAVRQQVSPQHHRHGPGQDTTPKEPQQPHHQPPGPRAQPLRRCSGTGTGRGVPSQVASWLPGTLAPLGVSQAQQSCLGAPASRPMMVSQPGAGGVLPAAMAPCPTRAPTGRAGRGHSGPQPARLQGQHGADVRSPPHGRVGPACVLPSARRDLRVQVVGLQGGYSQPSARRLPPASSLNPRETRKRGVPDGPTRSLVAPGHLHPAHRGPGSAPHARPHAVRSWPRCGSQDPGLLCPPPARPP